MNTGLRDSRLMREAARPGTGLDPKDESGGAEGNRPNLAPFIDHLSTFETPAILTVRRMAEQIREQGE